MSTAPCFPVSSASEGRSFESGGEVRFEELASPRPRFKLRTLALADCPFINGEFTLGPTNVLELIVAGWPMTDPALETGRDWATPA
jgi:hypothetical protein